MYRNTYLQVDCEKLKNNIENIKENYPDYNYYFGVVKANAYGHGGFIINSLIEGGINYLAVSSLEEAIALREFNKEIPILVLEPVNLNYIEAAITNNITLTISNVDYFKKLLKQDLSNKLKIHIKLDTGMSRLGLVSKDELNELLELIPTNSNIFLEGLFTHFATSGINDKHWDDQLQKFKDITQDINLENIPIVHMGRSLTLVNHKKIPFCNGIRLGIAMYGMAQNMPIGTNLYSKLREFRNKYRRKKLNISETTVTNNLNISPAIKLYSEIIEIRNIKPNDFIGYGAKFIAKENMRIATVPIGYADGISKNIKHVEINGKIYNVVSIYMDMISIAIDDSVKLYDKVILVGGNTLTVKKVTAECGINSYTLFTSISNRVPRVYIKNGNETEIKY